MNEGRGELLPCKSLSPDTEKTERSLRGVKNGYKTTRFLGVYKTTKTIKGELILWQTMVINFVCGAVSTSEII